MKEFLIRLGGSLLIAVIDLALLWLFVVKLEYDFEWAAAFVLFYTLAFNHLAHFQKPLLR